VEIKILGTGCPSCRRLEALVRSVAASGQPDADFIDVTDIPEILSYGVMHTPALVVDGTLLCSGRIPSKQELVTWLTQPTKTGGIARTEMSGRAIQLRRS
jgi:small redox-active disulfide protein 2